MADKNNDINPVQIQKYLGGLDYPVKKQDLVERARKEGAPDDVLSLLQGLPDREYNKPTDVTKAVS